ncbi:hypothetical protein [Vibrio alginolyticus]|uniref:hypothetical protein n=1 Tax=Vibrio alginolyticus TaxID=663 RepID=UPI002119C26C|nr:hypothetical protein [Vibrio alginolyticus]MCQ9091216.1 hypothetical protein [Vibrio alginolyticus]
MKLKEQGYGKKLIYTELKEHFDISYSQFTRIWDKELNESIPKAKQAQPKRIGSNTDKPKDPFRRKTKPIHNPHLSEEQFKELIG